ncbi:MAG TPA: hypothetical protein VGC21_09485 [Telluria sp.]|jgi:hydroxyethylthiazole kinase-like sugar kinase family protein
MTKTEQKERRGSSLQSMALIVDIGVNQARTISIARATAYLQEQAISPAIIERVMSEAVSDRRRTIWERCAYEGALRAALGARPLRAQTS